jgi:predicted NBD/HSP70 family sugar kinase
MAYYLGIDVGGSHVGGVCIDGKLKTVSGEKVNFSARRKKKVVVEELEKLIREMSEGKDIRAIGIGVPGAVKDGVLFWCCNSPFLEGTDFSRILRKFSKRVVVDNDVNCMAFGELCTRREKNILAVTLGTGVGGGIVIDGRLHNKRPYAGEVGHMSIDPLGVKCTCGSRGCIQEYLSTRGIMKSERKYFTRKYTPDELYVMARQGDRKARKVWEEYGKLLGVGLANLANILDPEVIVLGGGISEAFDAFGKSMREEMKKRLKMDPPKVVNGKEQAVAFGASCMAMHA